MSEFWRHTWDLLLKGGVMISGLLAGMAHGSNPAILLLLALMVADYLSGLAAAFCRKSDKTPGGGLSSRAGSRGLLRKALMLLVVLLGYALDGFIGEGNAMFQSAVTWFYIGNESLSLLENLSACGVPIPERLRASLEELSQDRGEARKPGRWSRRAGERGASASDAEDRQSESDSKPKEERPSE